MVKSTKRQIRQLKTALHWKIPEVQRRRIQMVSHEGWGIGRHVDNVHVAEDYLARTTTMYHHYHASQLVGLVLYPEPNWYKLVLFPHCLAERQ
jgi:hypothetical protein